ncbi:MAG: hypothetical protein HY530_07430 [Chloroflexi bacterium]|nr:hypothetical protein [Chloroflexota bacterium]
MAKNPLITGQVRQVIAEIYLKHPDWRAKEIRDGVEVRVHEQNPRSKPGWPGLSAVQKELTKLRITGEARPPELKKLDTPWSLGCLVEYELPVEAVPTVLEIKWRRLDTLRDIRINQLTFRQAKWIARLYRLAKDTKELEAWAVFYALLEVISELTNITLDTSGLDDAIFRHNTNADILTWWGWLSNTNDLSYSLRKELLEREIGMLEQAKLGLTLGLPNFSPLSDIYPDMYGDLRVYYYYLLWLLSRSKKWANLATETREELVFRLRDLIRQKLHDIPNKVQETEKLVNELGV